MIIAHRLRELVGMSTVRVHVANRFGRATIAEENHQLMDAFGVADVETKLGQSDSRIGARERDILPELRHRSELAIIIINF